MTNSTKPVLKLVGGTDIVKDVRRPSIDLLPPYAGWCLVDACVPIALAREIEALVKAYR